MARGLYRYDRKALRCAVRECRNTVAVHQDGCIMLHDHHGHQDTMLPEQASLPYSQSLSNRRLRSKTIASISWVCAPQAGAVPDMYDRIFTSKQARLPASTLHLQAARSHT
jgi:hypothetical protein